MTNFEQHAAFESNKQPHGDQHGWQHASSEGYARGALLHRLDTNSQQNHDTNRQFGGLQLVDNGHVVASTDRVPQQPQHAPHTGMFGSWHTDRQMAAPNEQNLTLGHTFRRTIGTEMGHVLYSVRQR